MEPVGKIFPKKFETTIWINTYFSNTQTHKNHHGDVKYQNKILRFNAVSIFLLCDPN